VRFLVVDDDHVTRELLRTILSRYAQCDLAFDGKEGIAAVRLAIEEGRPYDLLCLDIMMPQIDGHQALKGIRQLEAEHGIHGSAGTKVIMTTALRDSKHCIRSFREGCESYCIKPVQQEELLKTVRSLLGELQELPGSESAPPDAAPPRKNRYLIVDDDRLCREFIRAALSPLGQCSLAYDGREAIDAVRLALEDGKPYDLICLDIMMPGIDGHDALKGIRQLESERGIYGSDGVKVIMTTALRESKHCVQSFREGCECYVTKPIKADELREKVRELGVATMVDSWS